MRNQARHKPVIAAVLIVRDEARCIKRCLKSVRPFVDKIVVLDTGSLDDTPALARAMGAQVHHLPWPGDFSIARNHALDLADADWNLIIDADEWIAKGGKELRRWCGDSDWLGKLCVHSSVDSDQASGSERRNWITRLLPRGARFEGRVHEQVASDLPRVRLNVHIAHDGYLKEQVAGKRGRNTELLLQELRDKPADAYVHYQLGKDAEMHEDLTAAAGYYDGALKLTGPSENWRHSLVIRAMHCLGKVDRIDDALALADREMPNWPASPDFFFVFGHLLLSKASADPSNALADWLPLAAGAWERCLEIGEQPDLEGSMPGCGSSLARHNLEVVQTQIALFEARAQLSTIVKPGSAILAA